jgi:hypothetical protein
VRAAVFALLGLFVGAFVGYMAGVLVFCYMLWPDSPQCGLVAVFVAGPLGAIAGAVGGALLSRRTG